MQPSNVWDKVAELLSKLLAWLSGFATAYLTIKAKQNENDAEALAQALDVERSVPVSGAAKRLRESRWNRDRNKL